MMEQRTEDYRDVLEDLARSRGMSGAEELARRVHEVDPEYSVRDILEAAYGGFGVPLDKVIGATEEEKRRLSDALAGAGRRARALGICSVPGCKRPASDDTFGCKEHVRAFDAQAEEGAWELALNILRPWVEAAEHIGSDELTRVMRGALAEAEREYNLALTECEEADAALESA